MTKHNAANERVKRDYYRYLKEARGRDEATVDAVAKSLARFEDATGRKEFRRFHREQAVAFKRRLADALNERTGERLSKATMLSTLRDLRAFFIWLSHLPAPLPSAFVAVSCPNTRGWDLSDGKVATYSNLSTLRRSRQTVSLASPALNAG